MDSRVIQRDLNYLGIGYISTVNECMTSVVETVGIIHVAFDKQTSL
jgi:hypothetical protein